MRPLAARLRALGLLLLSAAATGRCCDEHQQQLQCPVTSTSQAPTPVPPLAIDDATRAYWMRQANLALPSPCKFAAFGTVIVNHTAGGMGELVCKGANNNADAGNPTLHGEIVGIDNCSAILTDPEGPYKLAPAAALAAFADLTLYTNGEPCPMCASAIRWAGFRECVFGTTIDTLTHLGWGQIQISAREVFRQSHGLSSATRLYGPVLANETDPFFSWQFDPGAPCPAGCARNGTTCTAV